MAIGKDTQMTRTEYRIYLESLSDEQLEKIDQAFPAWRWGCETDPILKRHNSIVRQLDRLYP